MNNVSIIIGSYNPKWDKLRTTLLRCIEQQDVKFEIIVTDDGSHEDYFNKVKMLMEEYNFQDYLLIKNTENLGTVKNYYNAMLKASGEYVFITSPGDYLYDKSSLFEFYGFAKRTGAQICFGNAAYYYLDGKKVQLVKSKKNDPSKIKIWDSLDIGKQKDIFFCLDDCILGSVFFRETRSAIHYFGEIKDICRYVEDNTSLMLALMDGIVIYHFDKYIMWYEYGTGISTSGSDLWHKRIQDDFDNAYRYLFTKYPNDGMLQFVKFYRYSTCRLKKYVLCLTKGLGMYLRKKYLRRISDVFVNEAPVDMSKFPKFDEE